MSLEDFCHELSNECFRRQTRLAFWNAGRRMIEANVPESEAVELLSELKATMKSEYGD